jgi:hypothetical protein
MIGIAMAAINAIVIPIISAACVLASADSHSFNVGASTSTPPSSSRVMLLSCSPNPRNPYSCPTVPNDVNGCPPYSLDPTRNQFCVAEKELQLLMSPGTVAPRTQGETRPTKELGADVVEGLPK